MLKTLAFDPRLPGLPRLFDPDGVARLFTNSLSQQSRFGPGVQVAACKREDVKYQPQTRCLATYGLDLQLNNGIVQHTIGVIDLTADGMECRLFDEDRALPWLAPASDPVIVGERLAAALPGSAAANEVVVTPVRYKPEQRCVFRYDVSQGPGGASGRVLFGKLLRSGDADLAAVVNALFQAGLHSPDVPRVLPVLAHWTDLHTLVQRAVMGGMELNTLAFDDREDLRRREEWLRAAGRSLAGLHECRLATGLLAARTLAEDLRELNSYTSPLEHADPELASLYTQATSEIESRAQPLEAPPLVTSHGAFRTDQFMLEDGALMMIDLDSVCLSNRARDPANFLAYLDWKEIRRPAEEPFLRRARMAFLEGYEAGAPAPDPAWLGLYRAASLLKIAGRRFRSLTTEEWPLVPRLVELACAITRGAAM